MAWIEKDGAEKSGLLTLHNRKRQKRRRSFVSVEEAILKDSVVNSPLWELRDRKAYSKILMKWC